MTGDPDAPFRCRTSYPDDYDFASTFDLDAIGTDDNEADLVMRAIVRRARGLGLRMELATSGSGRPPAVIIEFFAGDLPRYVHINHRNCHAFAALPFAEYRFLTSLDGIWDPTRDVVEASVCWRAGGGYLRYAAADGAPPQEPLVVSDPDSQAKLRLGQPSPAAQLMLQLRDPKITLALIGADVRNAADANRLLEQMGPAFLFQLGLRNADLPVLDTVAPVQDQWYRPRWDTQKWDHPLRFPHQRIRPEPLGLFVHAGTQHDAFLTLKFLAYYQVIEFHLPMYSRDATARTEVEAPRKARRGVGNERHQLRATLAECLDPAALSSMLLEPDDQLGSLGSCLADRNRIRGVQTVNARKLSGPELLTQLADRIYGIRNRIVHAKETTPERADEPLFPYAAEAKALDADIEVLRWAAAAVLIASAIDHQAPAEGV